MKKKFLFILFFLTSTAFAQTDVTEQHIQKLSQHISALEKEAKELRSQVAQLKQKKVEKINVEELSPSVVSSTAAIWAPATQDLAGLITSLPVYNLDLGLLKQKQQLSPLLEKKPLVELSGKVEIQLYASREANAAHFSDMDVSTIEFDVAAYLTPWITSFVSMGYHNDFAAPPLPRRTEVDQAFVTVGNLNQSPFYATAGQRFLPFGQYNTYMSSTLVTRLFSRTNAKQVSLNYQYPGNSGLYATLFAFQGNNRRSEWGSSIGYAFENDHIATDVGVDYISNLADSQSMQFSAFNINPTLFKSVPALAIHAQAEISAYTIIAEYISAITPFDPRNFSFNHQGAKPQALNVEINYEWLGIHDFAVGYSQTTELLGFFLPQKRFSTTYTYTFSKNLTFSLEYRRDLNYAATDTAQIQGVSFSSIPGYSNTVTGQVIYYF